MKFVQLIESNMLTELSKKGRWVTFKNGQRAYISKKGRVETGFLKGLTLGRESYRYRSNRSWSRNRRPETSSSDSIRRCHAATGIPLAPERAS